jgi:hypothetical protein
MKRVLMACGITVAAAVSPMPGNATTPEQFHALTSAIGGLSGATIFIIRHAEKPGTGTGLSPAGETRAAVYANYFEHLTFRGKPVRIDSLVAAMDSHKSVRPRLTLQPLSEETGMPIMQPCSERDVEGLVSWLRQQPANQTTLISWHHTKIGKLLVALGVDRTELLPGGKWPSDSFDWVIALRFDRDGHVIARDSQLVREPMSVDEVVWKTMDHPIVTSFASTETDYKSANPQP